MVGTKHRPSSECGGRPDDPDPRNMPSSASSSSSSASAMSSSGRATPRSVHFEDDDAVEATEAPATTAPTDQPPAGAAGSSSSLIPTTRRSSQDPQAKLPASVRRRIASPRGTRRRAAEEVEGAAKVDQRAQVISNETANMMHMAIADSPESASPPFMSAPFTDEELLAGNRNELGQLERFACVEPISISDAAAGSVIDA